MIRTILVPLDGSSLAERALQYAETLARAGAARLTLARVVHEPATPGRAMDDFIGGMGRAVRPIITPDPEGLRLQEEPPGPWQEAEAYLASTETMLVERGIHSGTALTGGDVVEGLLQIIAAQNPDLVVMATHGRSGLGRWVYGSVAQEVLRRSLAPVLLLRAWQPERALNLDVGRRIVVPLDGSPFSEAALTVAEPLAAQLGAELVLVRALADSAPEPVEQPGALRDRLAAEQAEVEYELSKVAEREAAGHPGTRRSIEVRAGAPAEVVAAVAEERGAAMVVMATHGRSGLARLALGSVAEAVLRDGTVPLLLVRPAALPVAASTGTAAVGGAAPPAVTLALDPGEVELVRVALQTLEESLTRREHLTPAIQALLARLPDSEAFAPGQADA